MRTFFSLLLLVALSSCDSSSSPTAPPVVPEPEVSNWSGSRNVVAIEEGADTCLGAALLAKSAETVRVALPAPQPATAIGSVQILELEDFCSVFVDNDGTSLRWSDWRCSQSCWWASFQCNGRDWSYCRSRVDFSGTQSGAQLSGSQIESYTATNGKTQYLVRARYAYHLNRN